MVQQANIHTGVLSGGDGASELGGNSVQQVQPLALITIVAQSRLRSTTLGQFLNQQLRIVFVPCVQNARGTDCGSRNREVRTGFLKTLIGRIALVCGNEHRKNRKRESKQ